MASTIAYGLTQSGGDRSVNEDALYLTGRIKPDMIGGRETESGRFTDRAQLYLVTDGFGGPGAGDLAGRIVFQVATQHLQKVPADPYASFDFPRWVRELMAESDRRICQELSTRSDGQAGCSVALLFLIDNVAYTMTLGSAAIYACRDGELFMQAPPQERPDGTPLIHLGCRNGNDVPVAQNIKRLKLQRDDQFLLLTDGAYRHVTTADIRSALTTQQAFITAVDGLYDVASNGDDSDNKTMLAVRVTETGEQPVKAAPKPDHALYQRPSEADVARLSREHREAVYDKPARGNGQAQPTTANAYRRAEESPRHTERSGARPRREERADDAAKGSLVSTFLKSLLLGFLIGLAIMLTIWFIFLS